MSIGLFWFNIVMLVAIFGILGWVIIGEFRDMQ